MSGNKAQELAQVAGLRLGELWGMENTYGVCAESVAIIADAIQEGMRLCKEECEAVAKVNQNLKPKESLGAAICARRIAALIEEKS